MSKTEKTKLLIYWYYLITVDIVRDKRNQPEHAGTYQQKSLNQKYI